jgi:TetR/AcrR family transcriptional regulator, transcriptional repressor for nem operon
MPSESPSSPAAVTGRNRMIAAATQLVRRQGFAATSVDEICRAAGMTKGAFFHHFASKDALAIAAADAWTAMAEQRIFTAPDWVRIADPLQRILAHIEFRLAMLDGPVEDFTCFVGTVVQEGYLSSPAIRAACDASITAYAERLAEDIQAAIDAYGVTDDVTALSLAFHIQAVLQGAFILAKARNDPSLARESVAHLQRYVCALFDAEGALI